MPQHNDLLWRVRLFDGPLLESTTGGEIQRFRSHKVAALLAFLALRLGRPCPREELFVALWPEEDDPKTLSNRLRFTLSSLRRQLEPAGIPFGSILDVSQAALIKLRSDTVWCDAIAFETAVKADCLSEASELAAGTFLPGFYEEWALLHRERYECMIECLPPADRSEEDDLVNAGQTGGTCDDLLSPHVLPLESPKRYPLPVYLTSFFGREEEIADLTQLVKENRLITLTGPGGMGKTRLVTEAARQIDIVSVFVPLADVTDAQWIPDTILRSLGVSPQADRDSLDQLLSTLELRHEILIILDNAEHLVASVADLALKLVECPQVRLLVTSRQRLDVTGETLFLLEPLKLSQPSGSTRSLIYSPAVALFLDRAKKARPDFSYSVLNADAVAEICCRVEGMPLALELAAARVIAQTPAQIATELAASLTGLKSRQRGLSKRHQSLHATVQGSLELLPQGLQEFFEALSVFRGGWTAEAASAVTGYADVREHLEELVVRSLIFTQNDRDGREARFAMLEPIRQCAFSNLLERGATASVQRAHRDYFLRLAETDGDTSRKLFENEVDNIRAAIDYCVTEPNGKAPGLRLAYAASRRWDSRGGSYPEALERLQTLLKLEGNVPESLLAKSLHRAGYAAMKMGRAELASRYFADSLEQATSAEDWDTAYKCLCCRTYVEQDPTKVLPLFTDAVEFARKYDQPHWLVDALADYGLQLAAEGQLDEARAQLDEALTIAAAIADSQLLFYARYKLAPIIFLQGDYALAKQQFESLIKEAAARDDVEAVSYCHCYLASINCRMEDFDRARNQCRESVTIFARISMLGGLVHALHVAAEVIWRETANACAAARLTSAARHLSSSNRLPMLETVRFIDLQELRACLGDVEFERCCQSGAAMSQEEATDYCLDSL